MEDNTHRERRLIDKRETQPHDSPGPSNAPSNAGGVVTPPPAPDVPKEQKAPIANKKPSRPHVPQS